MIHWHPYLVHFPIALILAAYCFYICFLIFHKSDFHSASIFIFSLAVVSGFFAGISGEKAALTQSSTDPVVLQLIQNHELYANLSIWGSIATLIVWIFVSKKYGIDSPLRWLIFILVSGCAFTIIVTGYFGGQLVYMHGVGVLM